MRRLAVASVHRRQWRVVSAWFDRAARRLGVHGYRSDRARGCAVDRELWAWWNEELQWMHADRRWRRPATGQGALLLVDGHPQRPPFPRRADGRADYTTARASVLTSYGLRRQAQAFLLAAA